MNGETKAPTSLETNLTTDFLANPTLPRHDGIHGRTLLPQTLDAMKIHLRIYFMLSDFAHKEIVEQRLMVQICTVNQLGNICGSVGLPVFPHLNHRSSGCHVIFPWRPQLGSRISPLGSGFHITFDRYFGDLWNVGMFKNTLLLKKHSTGRSARYFVTT